MTAARIAALADIAIDHRTVRKAAYSAAALILARSRSPFAPQPFTFGMSGDGKRGDAE
jgi:hypothetical protein